MAMRPTILVLGFMMSAWNCGAYAPLRAPSPGHDTEDSAPRSMRERRAQCASEETLRHFQNQLEQLTRSDAAPPPSGEIHLSSATVTVRDAQDPEISGHADNTKKAACSEEHPIMPSGIQSPASESSQDESSFAAQALERADEEARIAAILKKIAELELKMAEVGPPTASTPESATEGNSRDAARRRIAIVTAYAQQAAAYNHQLAASRARAAALYDFVRKPDSVGGKRMLEIERQMAVNDDPRYYDPNMPLIIAEMVAKEMHVAPKPATAPQP
jgi:hypothetical protein